MLTTGQADDSPQLIPMLDPIRVACPGRDSPRTRPDRVLADKTYSSRANREHPRSRDTRDYKPRPAQTS
ncbi:hypothetical protein [Corynebacterium halotolerans]|uniref:hypothetical protein n=1 Tax=Corynebacterium halotolerans TaxID=225326 RepID=UPI003CC7375C